MQTNATHAELVVALDLVNKRYGGNVEFNRLEQRAKRTVFTLKVKDAHGPGHRCGFSINKNGKRRVLSSACWHVHGHFFEALFKVNPKLWVISGSISSGPQKITKTGGNWQNWNVGNMVNPLQMSEACDCHGD